MPTLKRQPAARKGIAFPFQTAAVCWIDLLGYGAMIAEAEFNPLHPKAIEATRRLRVFHGIVASKGARYFPTLVMNDGAAAYRDLSLRSKSVTFDFLCRCWDLFSTVRDSEKKANFPGARMVLATGFRIRNRKTGSDTTVGHLDSILTRFDGGKIGARQAIREAVQVRRSFDVIPELQANFAFTKAYVAEQSGRRGGLNGAKCFVDLALFESSLPPNWMEVETLVDWKHDRLGLAASFAAVRTIRTKGHPQGGPTEVRDGLEVAQHLARDTDVLRALRLAKSR